MRTNASSVVLALALIAISGSLACAGESRSFANSTSQRSVEKMDFGKTPEGTPVEIFVLSNGKMTVKVIVP